MNRIFWDTNVFIYLFELNPDYTRLATWLRRRMKVRKDLLFTSSVTLGEIAVRPEREGRFDIAERYRRAVYDQAHVINFDGAAAREYSRIRALTRLRTADSMQLACAAATGVDLFVTNDLAMRRVSVRGIGSIASLEEALRNA